MRYKCDLQVACAPHISFDIKDLTCYRFVSEKASNIYDYKKILCHECFVNYTKYYVPSCSRKPTKSCAYIEVRYRKERHKKLQAALEKRAMTWTTTTNYDASTWTTWTNSTITTGDIFYADGTY